MPTTDKWFLVVYIDVPKPGDWLDGEFMIGTKEEIQKEFEAQVLASEYPYFCMGPITAVAEHRTEVTYMDPDE